MANEQIAFSAQTDVGRRRQMNEDSVLAHDYGQGVGLFVVADGMGGAAAGEVASHIAIEKIAEEVTDALDGHASSAEREWGPIIRRAVEAANRAVIEERRQRANDMGTTAVAALVAGSTAYIINVGDSRAYLVAADRLTRLTKDHSLVQALVDSGQITEAEVRTHPQRNLIFRNLGEKADVETDLYQVSLAPGQWLLLCSDGLWEMAQDEEIQRTVMGAASAEEAARALVRLANDNGGRDNISAIVIQLK